MRLLIFERFELQKLQIINIQNGLNYKKCYKTQSFSFLTDKYRGKYLTLFSWYEAKQR